MLAATVLAFKKLIHSRKMSYERVFQKNRYTDEVLQDLAKFCRAHDTTYNPDARMHALIEGRREVWLRIQNYLKLTNDEIYELHKIKEIKGDENAR